MEFVCRDDDRNIWPDEKTRTFVENGFVLPGTDVSDPRNIRMYEELFGKEEEAPNPRIFSNKLMRKNRGSDDRISRDLSADQFKNLYSAVAFANLNGIILDVRVTITWELLGIKHHREAAAILKNEFIKPLRSWLHYKDTKEGKNPCNLNYIYVHEVGQKMGFHTHLLIDIPKHLRKDFRQWMKNRLTELSRLDGDLPKGTFNITCPPSYPINRQWLAFQYMCKGLDKEAKIISKIGEEPYVKAIDLIRYPYENPGEVLCEKKCGMSMSLNAVSRKENKNKYKSPLEEGLTDVRILYSGREYLLWFNSNSNSNSNSNLIQEHLELGVVIDEKQRIDEKQKDKLLSNQKEVSDLLKEEEDNKQFFTKIRRLNKRVLRGDHVASGQIILERIKASKASKKKREEKETEVIAALRSLDF